MNGFDYLQDKNNPLSHAYIVVGDLDTSKSSLINLLKERGIDTQGNSDFTVETHATFLIDDVSEFKSRAQNLSETNKGKFFIICTQSITREAQNALLKILEEPNQSTFFFICVPRIEGILATVISRVQIIRNNNRGTIIDLSEFFANSHIKKLEYIKKMLDSHEDDDTSAERREWAINFLNSIEEYIYRNHKVEKYRKILKEIYNNKKYLQERGASVKMILEEIVLLL